MWDVLAYMLEQYPDNDGARFGIFLLAVSMALSYLAGKSKTVHRGSTGS